MCSPYCGLREARLSTDMSSLSEGVELHTDFLSRTPTVLFRDSEDLPSVGLRFVLLFLMASGGRGWEVGSVEAAGAGCGDSSWLGGR